MKVDISFDDCHVSDLRAARLLKKYGFVGTFYFPSATVPRTVKATLQEIREVIVLECGQEIGGHTVSHFMDLKEVTDDKVLKFEIENNKVAIEQMLMKQPVTKFCYPRGRHDERVRLAVKNAGYTEARTTKVLAIRNESGDPFQTPTTVHMFPREEYKGEDWFNVATRTFHEALNASRNDPSVFFSLWGHSVELDRQGDWEKFEQFLGFMRHELSTE